MVKLFALKELLKRVNNLFNGIIISSLDVSILHDKH